MTLAGRPVESDLSAAAWVADALRGRSAPSVGSLVPPVFSAYARVFHPAIRYDGDDDVDVRWAEVAEANATVAHPLMEWGSITGSMDFFGEDNQSPLWDDSPAMGHLPEQVAVLLGAVLRGHTTTPEDCWFGLSTSWGDDVAAPVLEAGSQRFYLLRGPAELAAANLKPEPFNQSANVWWPADRAWFVATDVDLVTTFVGGSEALVRQLLAEPGLEVARASADQSVASDADTINPLPPDAI